MDFKQRQEERRKKIRHIPESERCTEKPRELVENSSEDKVNWEALSSELSWWRDEFDLMEPFEQYMFLTDMLSTPFMHHLSDTLNHESVSVLRDELMEIYSRLCLEIGMFPVF